MLNHSYSKVEMTRIFNGKKYKLDGEYDTLKQVLSNQDDFKEENKRTRRIKTEFGTYRLYVLSHSDSDML
jgi:hypothetical protein